MDSELALAALIEQRALASAVDDLLEQALRDRFPAALSSVDRPASV